MAVVLGRLPPEIQRKVWFLDGPPASAWSLGEIYHYYHDHLPESRAEQAGEHGKSMAAWLSELWSAQPGGRVLFFAPYGSPDACGVCYTSDEMTTPRLSVGERSRTAEAA